MPLQHASDPFSLPRSGRNFREFSALGRISLLIAFADLRYGQTIRGHAGLGKYDAQPGRGNLLHAAVGESDVPITIMPRPEPSNRCVGPHFEQAMGYGTSADRQVSIAAQRSLRETVLGIQSDEITDIVVAGERYDVGRRPSRNRAGKSDRRDAFWIVLLGAEENLWCAQLIRHDL